MYIHIFYGDVAQLEEHLICIQEVVGSIPIISTNLKVRRNDYESYN